MKRCPECQRTYDDEAFQFCRFDRATLITDSPDVSDSDTTVDLSLPHAPFDTAREISARTPSREIALTTSRQHAPSASIAVLPFVNMSADQENDYFCDGLAEEVLNALAHLDGLKVAARTSAFHFKNKDVTISQFPEPRPA